LEPLELLERLELIGFDDFLLERFDENSAEAYPSLTPWKDRKKIAGGTFEKTVAAVRRMTEEE
jgi:hypothetical protein